MSDWYLGQLAAQDEYGDVPLPRPGPHTENRNAAQTDLNMTPEERALYDRHLSNLWGTGGVDNPNGSRSTLYQAGVNVGGKEYNIPTVYDGRKLPFDEALARAKQQGIDKFPSYPTVEASEARYNQMHGYMDRDTGQYFEQHPQDPFERAAQRVRAPYRNLPAPGSNRLGQLAEQVTSMPSWADVATQQMNKDKEAFQTGGIGSLLADTSVGQELAGGFGGNTKGVRDPLWSPLSLQKLTEPLDMTKHRFTDVRVPVPKIVNPEKLVGGYGVFPPWDLSATNRTATHINDTKLERPVVAQGGMGYPEANPGLGLAATQGAAQGFETQMGKLAETGRPVYIMPQTMTPQAIDASHHVADPLGQLVKQAPITTKDATAFNVMMREQVPGWMSIKNKDFDKYFSNLDMGSKSDAAKAMAKAEWQKKGFPNVAGIRHAMSDVGLVDLPSNTIGATISRYTPGKGLLDTTHADYPKGIAAEHMGQLATMVPHEVGAPAIAKALAQRNAENFARGKETVLTPTRHGNYPTKGLPSAQYFDDEWLDNYMKYVNRGR